MGRRDGFYFFHPYYCIAEFSQRIYRNSFLYYDHAVHRPLTVYLFCQNHSCYPVLTSCGCDDVCIFNLKRTLNLARRNTTSRQYNCFDPTDRHRAQRHQSTPVITCQFFVEAVLSFWIRVGISEGTVRPTAVGFRAVTVCWFCKRIC